MKKLCFTIAAGLASLGLLLTQTAALANNPRAVPAAAPDAAAASDGVDSVMSVGTSAGAAIPPLGPLSQPASCATS